MEYTLIVTGEEVNTIGVALAKLPYEAVAKLILKLQDQVRSQESLIPNSIKMNEEVTTPETTEEVVEEVATEEVVE